MTNGELKVGSLAPDFRLSSSGGGKIELADYRGRSRVVLFFVRELN